MTETENVFIRLVIPFSFMYINELEIIMELSLENEDDFSFCVMISSN